MFILLIFTLVLAFGIQTLTATDVASDTNHLLVEDGSFSSDDSHLSPESHLSDGYDGNMNDK